MIKLNCTYEESKKILELGYDFTEICTEWQDRELSTPCITDKYKLPETACPIIPKAALEACLPTTLSFGFNEDVYLMYEYCDKEFQYYQSPDYYCSDGKIYYSSKSAYEAFLWCHENYPEELKKKFEEVMK